MRSSSQRQNRTHTRETQKRLSPLKRAHMLRPAARWLFASRAPRQEGRTMAIQQQPPLSVSHFDIAELAETFTDSVSNVVWDGQTLGRSQRDALPAAGPDRSGAKRYPVCRLVLTPRGLRPLRSAAPVIRRDRQGRGSAQNTSLKRNEHNRPRRRSRLSRPFRRTSTYRTPSRCHCIAEMLLFRMTRRRSALK